MNCVVVIVSESVIIVPGFRLRLVLVRNAVRPVMPGGIAVDIVTVPVKPRLWTDIVDVEVPPATKFIGLGMVAVSVKSGLTVKLSVVRCVRPLPVAVIVTV